MIGGRDIIIPTTRETEALDLAVRAIQNLWPHVVLEDGVSGEVFAHYRAVNFKGRREILAFRDQEAAAQWDALGADPSLDGTLVHFLLSDGALTLAVDAFPGPEILSFVEGVKRSLQQDIFRTTITREAA